MSLSALHADQQAHATDINQDDMHVVGYVLDTEADLGTVVTQFEGKAAWVRSNHSLWVFDENGAPRRVGGMGQDWQESVLSATTAAPPGSPTEGDRYLIPTGATGAWAGQDGDITTYVAGVWTFETPTEGWTVWAEDADRTWFYNGAAWVPLESVFDHALLKSSSLSWGSSGHIGPPSPGGGIYYLAGFGITGAAGYFPVSQAMQLDSGQPCIPWGNSLTGKLAKEWVPDFIGSGATHASGGVPDPGATPGTALFLREDATWAAPSSATHNVLSATHADTLTASVVRGDVLVGNSTPKWSRLAKGSANQVLAMDATATDVAWRSLDSGLGYVKGPGPVTANYMVVFDGSTGTLVAARGIEWTEDAATVAGAVKSGKHFVLSTAGGGNVTYTADGNCAFASTTGNVTFSVGGNLIMSIGSGVGLLSWMNYSGVAAPGTPATDTVYIYKKTGTDNALYMKGVDANEKAFRTERTLDWYASELEEVDADAAITANAEYAKQTAEGNLYEVGFVYATETAVKIAFSCPSWATRIKFKFMHRTRTSPGGSPSSWTPRYYVRTLSDGGDWSSWSSAVNFTALTLPASTTNWQFDEQTITLATLGITAGQDVEMTLSRLASTGLNAVIGVRRASLEIS